MPEGHMRTACTTLILFAFFLCALIGIKPAGAAEVPARNPAAATTATKKNTAKAPQQAADTPEKLQRELDAFAYNSVAAMNKHIKPGINSKDVSATGNGFTARYLAVDSDSVTTSYSPSDNKVVKYIGRIMYHEVEYACTAPTRAQALAGPFSEVNRSAMTELIKHMKGKWTY